MPSATITAAKFKASCLRLMEDVQRQRQPVTITKRGRPVAQIVPMPRRGRPTLHGAMKGTGQIAGDIVSPIGETWNAEGCPPVADLLLLDTHIWVETVLGHGRRSARIDEGSAAGLIRVSAISAWEVAMLEAKGRLHLFKPCLQWVNEALQLPGIDLLPLSPAIAVESTRLPGTFHGDPADRIIVASARAVGAIIVTRDGAILGYARGGHVRAIAG